MDLSDKHKCAVSTYGKTAPNPNQWQAIDWKRARRAVHKLQVRIVKAEKAQNAGKVKALQRILTSSFYAKALAVRKVTENRGRKTAGVDGKTWSTPKGKWEAIHSLKRRGYKPLPLKRVYILKSNGKLRPLSIPVMKDRAMQALYLLALAPVAECRADPNSYGFRQERSAADAIEQCYKVLSKKWSARYILDADIESCFDRISHRWILDNIPVEKRMLKKWLGSGFMEKNQFYPTKQGVPQGGIISPTITNMVLDGLERELRNLSGFKNHGKGNFSSLDQINFVRYCDDLVVTARNKEILEKKVKPALEEFLKQRGLSLSGQKTSIRSIDEGFDFLGQNLRKYREKLIIKPAKKSVMALKDKIREVFARMKSAPGWMLIRTLNPILRGWAYYHRHSCAKETFSYIDSYVFSKFVRWAKRMHPNKSWKWKTRKYFLTPKGWRFNDKTKENERIYIFQIVRIGIRRHLKVKAQANPYDPNWESYFVKRRTEKFMARSKPILRVLYRRQQGRCPQCQAQITTESGWHIHHVQPKSKGGIDELDNLKLLHPTCHRQIHSRGSPVIQPQQ